MRIQNHVSELMMRDGGFDGWSDRLIPRIRGQLQDETSAHSTMIGTELLVQKTMDKIAVSKVDNNSIQDTKRCVLLTFFSDIPDSVTLFMREARSIFYYSFTLILSSPSVNLATSVVLSNLYAYYSSYSCIMKSLLPYLWLIVSLHLILFLIHLRLIMSLNCYPVLINLLTFVLRSFL